MNQPTPRLLLAGTGSGCGKTTVTCALLQALTQRGYQVAAFKCGPDYIDPMFHRRITGRPCANLDLFLFNETTARTLLAKHSRGCDVSLIEGVMGFYDGLGLTSPRGSSYQVAQATESPVVLVVNAKGASLSVLAVIQGFLSFYPDNHIQGVILNQCTPMTYQALAAEIEARFQGRVRPLGYLPRLEDCALESRRLGLVTAQEVAGLDQKLARLARQAAQTIHLDGLLDLARQAPDLPAAPGQTPGAPVRIAVARDRAFCFYYEDNLAALEDLGAQLIEFSPLSDPALPPDIHGLYLGGGYPELYGRELSRNASLRAEIRRALEGGLPCVAECGGFLYLTQRVGGWPMVGFLPGDCHDTGRLTRFGYVTLRAKQDSMLCRAGETIPAHEFHYWDCDHPGGAFRAEKASGKTWDCVVAGARLYAGFPHLHFAADPALAQRFYETCRKEKERHAGNHGPHGH